MAVKKRAIAKGGGPKSSDTQGGRAGVAYLQNVNGLNFTFSTPSAKGKNQSLVNMKPINSPLLPAKLTKKKKG